MIRNEFILKMGSCKVCIIGDNFVLVIISKFKIGLIEKLVLFDMAEKLQVVVAGAAGALALLCLIPLTKGIKD